MQRCESQKAILDELESDDCDQSQDQSHNSKNCGLRGVPYKRLQREHLVLQRSFAALSQAFTQSLPKSQSIEDFSSNVTQKKRSKTEIDSIKRQMSSYCKREKSQTEPQLKISSIPVIIYKKLCKEHVILQRSFATVCQSLNEVLDRDRDRDKSQRPKQHISHSQQKKCNKKEDELKRKIEVLSLELQESRDLNELLEFRIHEFEHTKEIACNKCCELESQVLDVNNENQKLNERLNESKTAFHQLIAKYALKEEIQNILIQRNYNKNNVIDKNGYIGSAMTSEDEGLGDDTRRDHSSGPSSLADTQEPEYDVISERSMQSTLEFNDKEVSNDKVLISSGQQTDQTESVLSDGNQLLKQEVMRNKDLIRNLRTNVEELKAEKANLVEQVLELEEAENDSRLMSQRLQQQLEAFVEQYETIQTDLINANKTIDLNNNKIKSFEIIETELRNQIQEIKSILLNHSLIDNNSIKSENRFLDKNIQKNNDFMNRLKIIDNKDRRVEQYSTPDDSLYSFLWEKLYRLETQIDCLKQSYDQTNQSFNCGDSDDDLQLFISADKLSEGVSRIGSSFEVSQFDISRDQIYSDCEARLRGNDLLLSLPLCEAIKPERIDIKLSASCQSKVRPSSPHRLPSEMMDKICKLESNEQQLKERLIQLEWINKEFVRELELREKIFFERENNQKEWIKSENEFKLSICELKSQLNKFEIKEKDLKKQLNNFNENILIICNEIEGKKVENELQYYINICDLHKTKQKTEENDCKTGMESLERKDEEIDGQRQSQDIKQNNENIDLKNERQNSKEFEPKISSSVDCYNCCEIKLRQQMKDLENQKTKVTNQLKEISEKINFLTNGLNERDFELKKIRQIYEERIDILSEEHTLVEKELKLKMKEMESQTSLTVNELELERNNIVKQLEINFNEIKGKEFEYRKRINDLNENVDKIEAKILKLINNKSNFDKLEIEKMKLKIEINAIQSSEEELKTKLNEMMQKESAYEETLSKADKIIATLEHNYKQRIDELESSERNLKIKVSRLEETESRLRSSLRPERRTTDSYRKASDLVKQLIDCEAKECNLRQQIKTLELSVSQMGQQLETANQTKIRIESELKDQDELVGTVHRLQQQIDCLKTDLNKSLQSQDSLQDMLKETEKYYQKRDEEMQSKYKLLEDQKCYLEISVQKLRHSLRHCQQNKESFNSFSNNCFEILPNNDKNNKNHQNVYQNTEEYEKSCELDSNSINNEELDNATIHMEKCFQRAMAVVRLEIKQKDNIDNCLIADTDETLSSMSLSSSPTSSEDCDRSVKNFEVLMDERNDCLSSSSSTTSISSTNGKPLAPNNLKILRKVSSDSLLISWKNNDKDISSHEIQANESVVQRLTNPKATKTLIHRLDLNKCFVIKIKSISICGQSSDEVMVEFVPKDWTKPIESMKSFDDYLSDSSDSSGDNQMTRL